MYNEEWSNTTIPFGKNLDIIFNYSDSTLAIITKGKAFLNSVKEVLHLQFAAHKSNESHYPRSFNKFLGYSVGRKSEEVHEQRPQDELPLRREVPLESLSVYLTDCLPLGEVDLFFRWVGLDVGMRKVMVNP